MKKTLRLLLIGSLLLLSMIIPVSAENLQDSLVPQDRESRSVGSVELEYNEFPQHHYLLDTYVDTSGDWMPWNWADGAGKQIYIALMEIINAIWQLNVLMANFTMVIVQEAFELDFVSGVIDQIGASIQNIAGFGSSGFMSNGLWPLLVTFVFCLVGAWAAYVGMIKRESSRAWGGLISALIIFVCALGFFSNAGKILGGLNEWSSNLQSDILGVSASIVNPGASYTADEGLATVRNQMFDLMVQKPYLLMQYGTTEIDENRVNDLLAVDPMKEAEERQEKTEVEVNENENAMMSVNGIKQRAAFVPLLFIANSIIGTFLLIISGSIILFQLIFLVLALFAPVPLLMALVPRWQQTAVDWVMKLVHAQLMKIAIALLLTILFGVSAILYRATETSDLGYLGMMLLQILCFVGVWVKRRDLFSMVSTAANNVQSNTGQALHHYRQRFNQSRRLATAGGYLAAKYTGSADKQPLANRKPQKKIGLLNEAQAAERKKQVNRSKERLASAVGGVMLADRQNQEFREGQALARNAASSDIKSSESMKLKDRTPENAEQQGKVAQFEKRRRKQNGVAKQSELSQRPSLGELKSETPASLELPDEELFDRQQTERTTHLKQQHQHQENLKQTQNHQLVERRKLDKITDRSVSDDVTNRERIENESKERNVREKVHRNQVSNEASERTTKEVTDRVNRTVETNREIQEQVREKEQVTHRISRTQEQPDAAKIVEYVKKHDKPLTRWEAEQLANAKRDKE